MYCHTSVNHCKYLNDLILYRIIQTVINEGKDKIKYLLLPRVYSCYMTITAEMAIERRLNVGLVGIKFLLSLKYISPSQAI